MYSVRKSSVGTLHLTTHHLIFKDSETRRELWISYPIISNVCRRQSSNVLTPAPTAHQLQQVNPHSGVASQSPISAAASQQNPYTNALESQNRLRTTKIWT